MEDFSPGRDVPTGHTSMVLQLFLELLDREAGACVLDLGPILGDNILFFSHRVKKLHVCDLFHRLDRVIRQKRPPEEAWRNLNYPPSHFNGILLWDLLDHLDRTDALGLAQFMDRWLKPEGMVVVFSRDLPEPQDPFTAFSVQENYRMHPKAVSELHLPEHRRQNREIMALLPAFLSVKSFIYRNGIREHLFRVEKIEQGGPEDPGRNRDAGAVPGRFRSPSKGS